MAVQLDNDILTFAERDVDYTGGLALLATAPPDWRIGDVLLQPLGWLDRAVSPRSEPYRTGHRGLQLGLAVFTPRDLQSVVVNQDDRPYANLVYFSASRTRIVPERETTALQSSLTLGLLGSSLGEGLHRVVHRTVGEDPPRGYGHEISRGGEPTLRYSLAYHRLLSATDLTGEQRLEIQRGLHLSVGYVTQTSASLTMRIGRYQSPWWRALPDETMFGVNPANAPDPGSREQRELYGWVSLKLNHRLYNALLQGQWRESEHRLDDGALERVIMEAAVGVTWQPRHDVRLGYELRWSSPEMASGSPRNLRWAGLTISFTS